jgi:hypothetical protein
MRKRTVFGIGIVSFVASLLMLQLTTPQMVGPLGVLAFFVLVYIFFACVIYLALGAAIGVLKRTARKGKWAARLESVPSAKLYYYSSFIALAPVIMLGMRSVGLLRPVDVLLVVVFELLGCFYISRRF